MSQETVAKQSSRNIVNLIVGFGIGAISNLLIFPHFFDETPSLLGAIQVSIAYIYLISDFATLGSPALMVRYLSKELKEVNSSARIWFVSISLFFVGFSVYMLFWLLAPEILKDLLGPVDNGISQNFTSTVSTGVFFVGLNKLYSGFLNANGKTHNVSMANELLMRLFLLIWCVLFVYVFNEEYESSLSLVFTGVNVYLLYCVIRQVKSSKISLSIFKLRSLIDMFKYSLINGLGVVVNTIQQRAEIIILAMLLGTEDVAIYNIGAFLATVVLIPTRAIAPMAITVVAQSWSSGDMARIQRVYSASAISQLLLSAIVFIAVLSVLPIVDIILPNAFLDYKWVFLLLGVAKLAHVSFGINGSIIAMSSSYRVEFVISFLLSLSLIGGMFLVIPIYGKEGVALVSLASFLVFNLIRLVYIRTKFELSLFSKNFVYALTIVVASISMVGYLSLTSVPIFISTPVSFLMIFLILWIALRFEWSEDLNKMIFSLKDQILSRLK